MHAIVSYDRCGNRRVLLPNCLAKNINKLLQQYKLAETIEKRNWRYCAEPM